MTAGRRQTGRAGAGVRRTGGGLTVRTRRRLGVVTLALVAAFAVVTALVASRATKALDWRVRSWVLTGHTELTDRVAHAVTDAGPWWATGGAAVVIAAVLALARRARDGLCVIVSVALASGFSLASKLLFRRTPPLFGDQAVKSYHYSYPSGHTLIATALAASLVLVAWPTRWRLPVLAGGIAYAGAMGLSGLMLNGHWATDIVASWVLGAAVALGVRLVVAPAAADGHAAPATEAKHDEGPAQDVHEHPGPPPVTVVLVDWGGTLMEDDGTQDGPMATWPRVAAVDGAAEALAALRDHYEVLVATSAEDSGERDVRAALARVGLHELVDGVVSSRDVRAAKPDPFFYRAALLRAGRSGVPLPADQAVMVGDSWANDIEGARGAGLRTVWFNRTGAVRPPGTEPPDGEVAHLRDLPRAVAALERRAASADR